MPTCREAFEQEGEAREVAGNQPLALSESDGVWLVGEGVVDVFAMPIGEDGSRGPRMHLCRVQEGELLVGGETPEGARAEFVAVGVPGSRLLRLSRARLSELVTEAEAGEELVQLLDAWIRRLTDAVSLGRLPRDVRTLSPNQELSLKDGQSASPTHAVSWARPREGRVRFLGTAAVDGEVFPLGESGWLTSEDDTKLETTTTKKIVAEGGAWPGLERFHRAVAECAAKNAEEYASAELSRLHRKAEADEHVARSAQRRLATAVEPEEIEETLAAAGEDPLLAACRLVGGKQGIAFEAPRNYGERQLADPVAAVARASNVRTRRVLLSGKWWTKDGGPLLGFRGDDDQPVAILPTSTSSYEIVDSGEHTRTPVTAETASDLQPFAYVFSRSFAPGPITLPRILRFGLLGTRRDWLVLVLLGLAGGVLGLLVPMAFGWIVGHVIPGADRAQLALIVFALTVGALVTALFEFTQGVAMLRIQTRMDGAVESGIWDRLLNLPASFFRGYTAGDLAMRAMGVSEIREALTEAAVSSLLTFAFSLVAFVLLFYYDPWLALLATVVFLVVVAATLVAAYFQLPYEREQNRVRGKVTGIVLQLVSGISRLRVAGAEGRALAYWASHYSDQTRLSFRSQSISGNLATFTAAVPIVATLVVFAAVAQYPPETFSLATFLAFNAAFVQVVSAAVMMSGTVSSVLEIVPLYERARPIFEARPEYHEAQRDPGELTGDIEISHVSFRYDDGPLVLDDVTLHVRPGEFVAFVGPSGAGKSTILRLLLGFEAPTSGSIYYDREDLAGLDQQSVRQQIGVVLQNSELVPGEIYRNIIGSAPLTMDDAWDAARLAGMDEEIEQMPMGMYTFISEGESTLSGGQVQRLMIARAVVSKPKLLFFDEATSALDNVTQEKVAKSLETLKATRVVVAHRLSTVMNADRIVVVDGGRIVQQGRYEELMQQPGLFAELAARQLT